MTAPKRYLDDSASDLGARLLRSAESDGPSERSWQRALTTVAAATAATAATGSGAASLLSGGVSVWIKWLGVGAFAGIVTTFGVGQFMGRTPVPSVTAPARPNVAIEPAPEPKAPELLPAPVLSAAPAPKAPRASAASTSSEAPRTPVDSLARELELVDAARRKLASGDPLAAIAKLDEYRKEFPRGRFAEEAALIRAEAAAARGDCNTVRQLRVRFDGDSGRSVLGRRWKALAERCP